MLKNWQSAKPDFGQGEYFVWSVPDRPVSVHLDLSLVGPLNAAATEALGSLPKRGLEIGGLLIGRVRNPNPGQHIVSIERLDPFEIEHVRGPSYIMSSMDREELFRRLRKYGKSKDGLGVVGFYRSHTRPGLFLDEYDYELMRSYFAHASSVALVMRPVLDGPATAGFFIWEDGEVRRSSTYRDFLLQTDLLRTQQPVAQPDASAPQASPLPATSTKAADKAPEKVSEKVPEKEPPSVATVVPSKVVVLPATHAAPEPAGQNPFRNPVFAWSLVGVASLIAAAALLQNTRGTGGGARPYNVLSLNIEPAPPGLRLTWDRQNPLIAKYGTATLSISDGDAEKQIVLDGNQLKSGGLVYWPTSQDVNFRLRIGDFSESLRALVPQLTPKLADAPAPQPQAATIPEAPVQRRPQPDSRARVEAAKPAVLPAAQPARPKAQEFVPPPPAEIGSSPVRLDRPAPAVREPGRPQTMVEVEPVRASGLTKAVGAIPGFLFRRKNGENGFVPAKAVQRVNPSIPASAKPAEGTRVSVKLSLDEAGRVKGTDLVTREADSQLANAVMDAARRWRFEPARQQNKAVGSSVILHFRF